MLRSVVVMGVFMGVWVGDRRFFMMVECFKPQCDGRTDGPTDRVAYRVSCTRLKNPHPDRFSL